MTESINNCRGCIVGSRIHREVYVRFRGEGSETCCRETVRRRILSLQILSEKFELFQGVFGASDKAIGLLESGADFEKRVTQIYQECITISDFTKEFKALEKELDKKKNKKMDELKSLFTYKPQTEHRQCFDKILEEISQYDNQLEYWSNIDKLKGNVIYPLYYEINVPIDIPSIKHGYLLIGGAYVEDVITEAVFEIVDTEGKIYGVTDSLARTLGVKLQTDVLVEKEPDNQRILAYIDKITDYMKQNSIISKKPLVERNQKKISNWLQLRKDDYLLKARDISEIEKIREEYISETDFMQKIALKKQIEILEEEKQKLIETFHVEMTELEREADGIQKEFEDSVLKLPQLIIKIAIKF